MSFQLAGLGGGHDVRTSSIPRCGQTQFAVIRTTVKSLAGSLGEAKRGLSPQSYSLDAVAIVGAENMLCSNTHRTDTAVGVTAARSGDTGSPSHISGGNRTKARVSCAKHAQKKRSRARCHHTILLPEALTQATATTARECLSLRQLTSCFSHLSHATAKQDHPIGTPGPFPDQAV